MRITCVVRRFDHHTASGGYDRLAAAVGANVIVHKDISGLLGKGANKIWRHLTPKENYYYRLSIRRLVIRATGAGSWVFKAARRNSCALQQSNWIC